MTSVSTGILGAALAASAACAVTAPAPPASRRIVFVCEHGAAKSVVAAAHFNRLARERGIPYHAVAKGADPQAELAPSAVSRVECVSAR